MWRKNGHQCERRCRCPCFCAQLSRMLWVPHSSLPYTMASTCREIDILAASYTTANGVECCAQLPTERVEVPTLRASSWDVCRRWRRVQGVQLIGAQGVSEVGEKSQGEGWSACFPRGQRCDSRTHQGCHSRGGERGPAGGGRGCDNGEVGEGNRREVFELFLVEAGQGGGRRVGIAAWGSCFCFFVFSFFHVSAALKSCVQSMMPQRGRIAPCLKPSILLAHEGT